MKDSNKLNYIYDDNGFINNMVSDNDGNLNVIASVINNVNSKNCDNRVIGVKDIPSQFNVVSVKNKTDGVIRRVNLMLRNNVRNNDSSNNHMIKECKIDDKNNLLEGIMGILLNRRVMMCVIVLVFVFSCITVGKTFSLRNRVNKYNDVFTDIEEKKDMMVSVYEDDSSIDSNGFGNGAAFELVNCIGSSIDMDNLPSSIDSIIDEINDYYNKSNNYFAFKYKDIYTGFSVSYNEKQNIFTASTIKAPKDIYIYEMASLGKINLDDELTYTAAYYNTGTGILKNKSVNTKYSVRDLVEYSIVYSDNAAHNMLMDKYGRSNMLLFWRDKGTNAIFTENNNWGVLNANDASIYMSELYRFYLENKEYGEELLNNFINAKTKFITSRKGYKVANKSGWSGSAIHDVAIVFADNPYIVIGLSNLGNTNEYGSYFNKVSDFAYRLHTEYWKYKMDMCSHINQY